jgi:hypothetical protein
MPSFSKSKQAPSRSPPIRAHYADATWRLARGQESIRGSRQRVTLANCRYPPSMLTTVDAVSCGRSNWLTPAVERFSAGS